MNEQLGIVGAGAIACGLAASAAAHGDVVLWARSPASAERDAVQTACGHTSGEVNSAHIRFETYLDVGSAAPAISPAVVETPERWRRRGNGKPARPAVAAPSIAIA